MTRRYRATTFSIAVAGALAIAACSTDHRTTDSDARLHRPWREHHAHHFALDFLPAYSPELNPIERVWKLTRRRCLHNRYFDNLQAVIGAVESEFATWTTRNDVLRRLCAIT